MTYEKILPLLDYIEVNSTTILYHFRCKESDKKVIATMPFEPYDGKVSLKWTEILLHPFKAYYRYYHTPIVIYSDQQEHSILLKAFNVISHHFIWNEKKQKYIYK